MAAFKPALHQRVHRLRLLKLAIDVPIRDSRPNHPQHDRSHKLDHRDHKRSVRDGPQMVRQHAAQRLQQRRRPHVSLLLLLLEVPLPDRARHHHHTDRVDEPRSPEPHEQVPERQDHVARRRTADRLRDQRAVRHRFGVFADHRRGVLR